MTVALTDSASALGLYRYECGYPSVNLMSNFHDSVTEFSNDFGIEMTYFGAGGLKSSGKLLKTSGKAYRTLLDSGFDGVTRLTLVANPPESTSPALDGFIYASVGLLPVPGELQAVAVFNDSFVKFGSPEYERLAKKLLALTAWDCGYGFAASAKSSPELHLLGASNGSLSPQEWAALCRWYAAPAEARRTRMRDVYAYNLLNDAQLAAPALDGMSLREFAERQPECSLTRATDYGLHLWRAPEASIPRMRNALASSSALIASNKR